MSRVVRVSLTALAVLLFPAALALADISEPPPEHYRTPGDGTAPFEVRRDGASDHARLIIPRSLLEEATSESFGAAPRTRTIIAGTALSLAIGGTFFLRRGSFRGRGFALVAVAIAGIATVSVALADIPSPFGGSRNRRRPIIRECVEAPREAGQHVKIEVVDGGDTVVLILNERGSAIRNEPRSSAEPPTAEAPSSEPKS